MRSHKHPAIGATAVCGLLFALSALVPGQVSFAQSAIIETIAGGGPTGIPAASFTGVSTSVMAADSGDVYFSIGDQVSFGRIYKVDPNGVVTLIAGNWVYLSGPIDGKPATKANIGLVGSMVRDAAGNLLFAEINGGRVLRIDAATGLLTTVAGVGPQGGLTQDGVAASLAHLSSPFGLALDAAGNLYVSEWQGHRVRRVSAGTGIITTVAGTGIAGFAGDGGPAASARINGPREIALDASGNLYIADADNHRVRKVSAATGLVSTLAGNGNIGFLGDGGPATNAWLTYPSGLALDAGANLFISDWDPNGDDGGMTTGRIRRVDAATGTITLYAGGATLRSPVPNGIPATQACMHNPDVIDMDAAGNLIASDKGWLIALEYFTLARRIDAAAPHLIWSLFGYEPDPFDVVDHGWGDGGPAISARIGPPTGLVYDPSGNLYIAGPTRIRRVSAANASITTVAGTGQQSYGGDGGPATAARLNDSRGIALDVSGNLFVADRGNHRIRRVDAASGMITTYAGTGVQGFDGDGRPATHSLLDRPSGVSPDAAGNVYLADTYNNRVRVVTTHGKLDTVAGDGTIGFSGDGGDAALARLARPHDVRVAPNGDLIIADTENARIRRVTTATGIISTIAGDGTFGYAGDGGPAAGSRIGRVETIGVDLDGNILIADIDNDRIRRIEAASGTIDTVAGAGVRGAEGDGGLPLLATLDRPKGIAAFGSLLAFGGGYSTLGGYVRQVSPASAPTGAGEVPELDPTNGPGLRLTLDPLGLLTLSWTPSCATGAIDYEVYQGSLGAFASHAPLFCTTGGQRIVTFAPDAGNLYYLVVPRSYASEGFYGRSSAGEEIPAATGACLPQEINGCI